MATGHPVKIITRILSLPFLVLSRVFEYFDILGICFDLRRCLETVDSNSDLVPQNFVSLLVCAEDRRSSIHCGVDPIAMIRAFYKWIFFKKIEGASTIEQQFVRVISGRYERSFMRKIREQILAIAVSRRRSKCQIASAYLSVAYYGYGRVGLSALKYYCGPNLSRSNRFCVLGAIARLKYPEPRKPSIRWYTKFERRVRYIANLYNMADQSCVGDTIPKLSTMKTSVVGDLLYSSQPESHSLDSLSGF